MSGLFFQIICLFLTILLQQVFCNLVAEFLGFLQVGHAFLVLFLLDLRVSQHPVSSCILRIEVQDLLKGGYSLIKLIDAQVNTSFFKPVFYILRFQFHRLVDIVDGLLVHAALHLCMNTRQIEFSTNLSQDCIINVIVVFTASRCIPASSGSEHVRTSREPHPFRKVH